MNDDLVKQGLELKKWLDKKKQIKAEEKEVNATIAKLQGPLVEAMELHQVQNFMVKGLGKFYLQADVFSKIIDVDKLHADLRSKGVGELIKETIATATLKAYVKECIDNDNALPEGVEIYPKTNVRFRKK